MIDEKYPADVSGGRSHLGAGSRITGTLFFPGSVELPGYVKGRVEASAIVLDEAGEVEGEIHGANIAIKGRFKGQVVGGTIRLHSSARVTGGITYESLSIDSGAEVEGQFKSRPYTRNTRSVDQPSGSAVE